MVQSNTSIIDGNKVRTGVVAYHNSKALVVTIDHFTIQNGFDGGISNFANLTISNSIITNNVSNGSGGGISNVNADLTLNDSVVSNNLASGNSTDGGGINLHNSGTITLNRSAVIYNKLSDESSFGSGISSGGNITLILNNSTVSGNTGGDGSGIYSFASTIVLNSSTIVSNEGAGISNSSGHVNLQNTIIALNGANGDCYNDGTLTTSSGYNLIGNGDGCSINAVVGDMVGSSASPIDPKVSSYAIGNTSYHMLIVGSPAINAANPATCPATDQRGVARPQGAGCDIGSYEYGATSGPAAAAGIFSGTNQSTFIGKPFSTPIKVYVTDSQGNPVSGVDVIFTTPSSGPSGVFANATGKALENTKSEYERLSTETFPSIAIYQVSVKTVSGVATAPLMRANSQQGSYIVNASVPVLASSISFSFTNLPFSNEANLLQNGGFEDPIFGNKWSAHSQNFGVPFCLISLCGNGGGTAGPHSGNTWVWFGGEDVYAETAYIYQAPIIIPKGPAHLRFYLWIGYAPPGSSSENKMTLTLEHQLDDLVIFTADATQQNIYSSYKLVDIDLSQYADNSPHSIKFFANTNGDIVNFNLDDISINNSSFADVAPNYWSWSSIERLYNAGVTGGCETGIYCPDNTVTRAQMAVFLLKGVYGSEYSPPSLGGNSDFDDVVAEYWAATWIKQLAAEGITSGCGNGNYCPENTVTRAQMALFLLKAKNGPSYMPPAVGGSTGFNDVETNYWAAPWIKQLVADGITSGCGGGNYCPDAAVTRAQMAVFLVKAFNLP